MNEVEPESLEESYVSLLAAGEQALAAGITLSIADSDDLPPEVQCDLKQDLACVELLRQVLPRHRPDGSGPETPLGGGPSELPWTSLGRFQIRRELGRGNFGIVYLAYDPRLNREIALKVPRVNALADSQLRERFQREARSAAALDHPNLVPVYEAGEVGPVCYIASAYCPGISLASWLKERDKPVPFRTAAALVAQVADGVDHAHRHGVVHRDLKPGNILLVSGGVGSGEWSGDSAPFTTHDSPLTPKITDFGLAKFFLGEEEASQTRSGALVGTPSYMAPEQAEGRRKEVGPPADVYALGVILYEVLTGRPPFQAESVLETLMLMRKEEPLPPRRLRPKLPRDLETICLKCLEKEPGKRFASAGDLAADLRRFLAAEPIQARPVGSWERVVKWARRRPATAALIAVSSLASVLLVTGLAVGLVVISGKQLQTENALRSEQKAREDLEQTSYLNGIGSAYHEISVGNWGRVDELLEGCPQKLCGWEWHYLKRLRLAPPIPPLPIGEPITMSGGGFDLAFHPNSRLLAIPSSDNRIRIWDTSSGQEVFTLHGHTGQVLALAFSPDGQRLASTSEDNTVKVWAIPPYPLRPGERGQEERRATSVNDRCIELREPVFTRHHKERVIAVAFSPKGQLLASVSGETDKPGDVKVWDAVSGAPLVSFPGPQVPNPVVHVAFSPDGRRLASGSAENAVKVWDIMSGQELYKLPGHVAPILNVTFSPDGCRLITAGRDRVVKVWDLPPGKPGASVTGVRELSPRWTRQDFSTSPWCIALSPDGSCLAIGGPRADGNVRVYDMSTGKLLHKLIGDFRVISVVFSPDGRRLASAGSDRIVRLWDTTTGQEVISLRGHEDSIGRLLFSPDGHRLASASQDGMVRVWDASPFDENSDPHIRTLGGPDDGEFNAVAFDPKGRWLASASSDKSIKLWDAQTGREIRAFHGHEEAAVCLAFSPDGQHLLSGSMDRTVKHWDVETGEELPLPDRGRFNLMVYSVAFSPDGHTFAVGGHQEVRLCDLSGRSPPLSLQADSEFVSCVAFSEDGKHLATVGHTGIAKIWDVASGEMVGTFRGPPTNAVAFHPTKEYVASGGSDGQVRLWDPTTGHEIRLPLPKQTDQIESVAFSPDGKYLATASLREVIVWDAKSFKKGPTFGRLTGRIWRVAFSPDGKRLAAATGYKGKGEIKIWDSTLWEQPAVSSP